VNRCCWWIISSDEAEHVIGDLQPIRKLVDLRFGQRNSRVGFADITDRKGDLNPNRDQRRHHRVTGMLGDPSRTRRASHDAETGRVSLIDTQHHLPQGHLEDPTTPTGGSDQAPTCWAVITFRHAASLHLPNGTWTYRCRLGRDERPGPKQAKRPGSNFTQRVARDETGDMAFDLQTDLNFAESVMRQAGEFTLKHFRSSSLTIDDKSDGSPVTEADRGAEELVRRLIEDRFPDDSIHGEEFADKVGTSGRRWVVDPIDGTKAFTRGVATYTNLLYLEDATGPRVGVINVPAIAEMVSAAVGLGAFFNGEPCRVNTTADPNASLLTTTGFDYWEPSMLEGVRSSGMEMRTWGDGYGYALVATGRVEAMVDPVINFWDIAPCTVIIAEAGGRFSTTDGSDDPSYPSFVATNGVIHDAVIDALNNR